MIPKTTERVAENTSASINRQIQEQTRASIASHARSGSTAIAQRLEELDNEWDVERTLEANAATVALVGVALGATVHRAWFLLPGAVAAFLLQHAVQGWCPPLPIFRRLGFRTQSEIEQERYALKALRGDFGSVKDKNAVSQAITAARP